MKPVHASEVHRHLHFVVCFFGSNALAEASDVEVEKPRDHGPEAEYKQQ
jgi:hypothetical protein